MANSRDALIDIYLSDQWRIHGGPREKSAREELRDLLIPLVIKAFGSVESSLVVLLKESPHSNGHRISVLIRAYQLYFLRRTREAVEAHDETAEQRCADYGRKFGKLDQYEAEKFGMAASDDEKISAILRTSICHLPPTNGVPAVPVLSEDMLQTTSPAGGIRPGEPLTENLPEDDPRHSVLVPYFEVMDKLQLLAEEYPTLSIDWEAEEGRWRSWPPPSRAVGEGEKCPSLPGSDLHIMTSAGEAAKLLLESPESWFNPHRDPWLDITGKEPWERWFYAIREFWLKAGEEAEDVDADTDEFAKVAEAVGYWHTHSPRAVRKLVWRKMVKSKVALRNVEQELRVSADVGAFEEPEGWVQSGRIKQVFIACAYFCGVLAAQRARQLEKLAAAGQESAPTAERRQPPDQAQPRPEPTADAGQQRAPAMDGSSGVVPEVAGDQHTREPGTTTAAAPDERPDSEGREILVPPEDRLAQFMQEHLDTTYADIKFSAEVYTAEFQDWRKQKLKPTSVMSKRIEDVLSGHTPLLRKPPKSRAD